MATAAQKAHALASYYEKCYTEHYKLRPLINRYKAQWGFDAILRSMSTDEIKALIDHYFKTISTRRHDLEWFFYNYDKLALAMERQRLDEINNAAIRRASEKRTQEWKDRVVE